MGSTHLLLLSPPPFNYLTLNPPKTPLNPNFSFKFRSSRRPNSGPFRSSGRFEFEDELRGDRRRNWWSDDDYDDDDNDEDDDEDDDGFGFGFGFWEEPNYLDWVIQVLKAFGWMIPAVLVSTLVGTGTNSLLMALVLPLGQTALSLIMDKVWGGPSSSPNRSPRSRPRPRPRQAGRSRSKSRGVRNPFVETANEYQRSRKVYEARAKTSAGRGTYQSWRPGNDGSARKVGESGSSFGGWDELDQQVGSRNSFSGEVQSQKVNELQRQQIWTGKLSRRRNREKPLLMRLLIAVFPFLGSWTRFLS